MNTVLKTRRKKRSAIKANKAKSNDKRSRFLRKKDEEILLEILIIAEKAGSFCPENLMRTGQNRLFEEAYRRFESWDKIIELCVDFSNRRKLFETFLKTPREIILDILRLETGGKSFCEANIKADYPDLYASAVLYYGSWHRVLSIIGIESYCENDNSQ